LGWTEQTNAEKIELDLMDLVPKKGWDIVSHTLIFHGRRVCSAIRPACVSCAVNRFCPSAFEAEWVGRKPPRAPRSRPQAKPKLESKAKKTLPKLKSRSKRAKVGLGD
jgi:endonuclease-3